MSPKRLLTRTMMLFIALAAFILSTSAAYAQPHDSTTNYLRIECPTNVPLVAGTIVSVPVYMANSKDLGAFTFGFKYDTYHMEFTSLVGGPDLNDLGGQFRSTPRDTALNTVLTGWFTFDPTMPIPVHAPGATEVLAFTMRFTVKAGVTDGCADLFNVFVPPAGPAIFAPMDGSADIVPVLKDCGTKDIIFGTGCPDPTNTPPIAVCQPISVAAGANCTAVADINNGSSDPDGDQITITQVPAGPYPLGQTVVSLIVTDNGTPVLADTVSCTVTVTDQTNPVVTCPANITVGNDVGACGAIVNFAATATDNCDAAVAITYSQNPATLFPVGATVVTATATDDAGNTAQCQFTVTVNDTQNPVAVCPADISVTANPGETSAIVNFVISATDNCSGSTAAAVPASGSAFPLGTTIVTVTATDGAGNTGQCQFNVTVNAGNAAPVVSDIPDQIIDQGGTFATIALDDYVTDPDDIDADIVWTTQLMKSKGDLTVSIDPGTRVATLVATPDFTGSAVFTFRATDPDNAYDEDQATFTVNAIVNDPPTVSDIPDQTITEGQLFTTISLDDFVVDPDDADNLLTWTFSGNTELVVAISPSRVATISYPSGFLGAETITFTATDPGLLADNDAATFTVNAIPNQAPVVADIPDQTILDGQSFAIIDLDDYVADPDNADNELTWTFSGNTELIVVIDTGNVTMITYPSGFTGSETVTFTATDPGLLADSDAATFTVNADLNPDFTIDVTPETITIEGGLASPFVYNIAIGSIDGFSDAVDLAVSGVGINFTGDFTVDPVAAPGLSTFNGAIDPSTPTGVYDLVFTGTSGSVKADTVQLEVGSCVAPPIVVTSFDTLVVIAEEGSNPADESFYVTNGAVCGTLYWAVNSDQPWVTASPESGNVDAGDTPGDLITLSFNTAGLAASGSPYTAHVQVSPVTVGKDVNADENGVIEITLFVTEKPISEDTVWLSHEIAYPDDDVAVYMNFSNYEELAGMSAGLTWSSSDVMLDSVSFAGSRVEFIENKITTIDNTAHTLAHGLFRLPPEPLVAAGSGLWATLWFSVDPSAMAQVVTIDTLFIAPGVELMFSDEIGNSIYPQFFAGSITINEVAENCISGYISDVNGGVEGATVELLDETGVIATTTTNNDGYYEFCFMMPPDGGYTVRAYKDGYYPETTGNVNLPDTDVNIVLEVLVADVTPTYEWVDLYCQGGALFNGEPVAVGSVIEAFDPDGVLCGRWVVSTPGTFGFMPVYVDDPYTPGVDEGCVIGDAITIMLDGASVDLSGDPLVWTGNGDRYEACFTAPSDQDVTRCLYLAAGWNLISLNVALSTSDLETLFADVMDNTDVILSFESVGLTYDPDLPEFSTLFEVDNAHGYWFRMDAADSICFTGQLIAASTPISIENNWNLVSYLPEAPLSVPNALASIWSSVVVVLGYENGGLSYDPALPELATLNEMKAGFGYWIKTNSAGTLIYPDGEPTFVSSVPDVTRNLNSFVPRVQSSNTWINLYGSDVKLDGQNIPAGTVIEAYNEAGIMVGEFAVRQTGKFGFMPVYGPDNFSSNNDVANSGKISFKINGEQIEQTIDWTANGDRVFVNEFTTLGKSGGVLPDQFSLAQNYPNPFNPETSIEYVVAKPGFVEVSIYNVMGAKVKTLVSDYQSAGTYSVKWYGNSDSGAQVASGVYFYKLTSGDFSEIKKMTLLK